MVLDALPIEVQESENRACKRDRNLPGWRSKHRKNAEQIGEQDEYGNGTNERNELGGAMVNVFFQEILDAKTERISQQYFGNLLHGAWFFDGESRTQ